MTLSSSIPFMMAHFTKSSVSLFWHNTADGWIDMKKGGQGWLSGGDQQVDTFWMFESGMVDLFVMLGPGPKAVSRQDGLLTGRQHSSAPGVLHCLSPVRAGVVTIKHCLEV